MINIIIKNKNFIKGPAQYRKRKLSGSGFVLLFAVTISAILLAIALGVAQVALKEVNFSTSAKDTNDAFFSADTGIEYALYEDKVGKYPASNNTSETIGGLSSGGQGCVIVTIVKTAFPATATFIAKGYNNGGGGVPGTCTPPQNSVERELQVRY